MQREDEHVDRTPSDDEVQKVLGDRPEELRERAAQVVEDELTDWETAGSSDGSSNGSSGSAESSKPETAEPAESAESGESAESKEPAGADAADDEDSRGRIGDVKKESFSLLQSMGGWGLILDAGVPGVAFIITWTLTNHNITQAMIVALAIAGAFAVVRLIRRDPMQNVVSGFMGVAIGAVIAKATGRPENYFVAGLLMNAGYLLLWGIANLVRWPLIGLVIGFAAGWGFEWRKNAVLMRAFMRAGWVWVAFFAVRLAVQVPLYFNQELGGLAIARLIMGWPLWVVVLATTFVVIKASVPKETWAEVRRAADQVAARAQGK